jgi:hypothetical protein
MTAWGHLHALPRRSIAVRFTSVSGIDSRSQGLPSRAITGREQMQQTNVRKRGLFDDLIGADEQDRRDFETERPGGSQIDH